MAFTFQKEAERQGKGNQREGKGSENFPGSS
jgi:hypothetical protein